MLSMKYISQLIGHTFGIAYLDIHVVVGVAIYPVIDAAILDVVPLAWLSANLGHCIWKDGT